MLMSLIRVIVPAVACLLPMALQAQDSLARGKYLLEEVGKCQECHTARTEAGELDRSKWLKGAVLNFKPIAEVKGWHPAAPDITPSGRLWERWGEKGLADFLTTGKNPRGGKAEAPMPTYTMTPADAKAVVDYLKTLK